MKKHLFYRVSIDIESHNVYLFILRTYCALIDILLQLTSFMQKKNIIIIIVKMARRYHYRSDYNGHIFALHRAAAFVLLYVCDVIDAFFLLAIDNKVGDIGIIMVFLVKKINLQY